MANFKFNMEKKAAVLAVKKALSGKVAILSDKNGCLTVDSPMMTVKVAFAENSVETSASLFGKVLLGTVNSEIEMIEGFEQE